uniref:Immunoglobulin domain-containing protein n=1 Tax=Ursus americanus TaxID=9643 RepID=A0A452QLV4_URSAM
MGLSLLLSLLLLPTCLQAGECPGHPGSAPRPSKSPGRVNQPNHLSAPMGGSVHINFSFYYCWELAKNSRVSVALRRTQFHGEFIYNSTWPSFHKDYKNRISLNLPKGQNSGSLQISNLRKEDENIYFCRVQVETREDGKKVWQARQGTKLTITHATQTPLSLYLLKGPTSTAPTTTGLGVSEGNGSSASSPLSVGAAVGVALAGSLIKIAILGLILYHRWRRSKGYCSQVRTAPLPLSHVLLLPSRQDEAQDNSGVLYASLSLSSSSSPAPPPCIPPQEETLYSLVKA